MNLKGIQYFKLLQPMPGAKVGDTVNISGDRKTLWINGTNNNSAPDSIDLSIELAKDPTWFEPVTNEQHRAICKENLILFYMDKKSCNREEAIAAIARIDWN